MVHIPDWVHPCENPMNWVTWTRKNSTGLKWDKKGIPLSSYEFKVERIKTFSAVSKSSHSIFSADVFEKGIAAIDFEDLVLESIYQDFSIKWEEGRKHSIPWKKSLYFYRFDRFSFRKLFLYESTFILLFRVSPPKSFIRSSLKKFYFLQKFTPLFSLSTTWFDSKL